MGSKQNQRLPSYLLFLLLTLGFVLATYNMLCHWKSLSTWRGFPAYNDVTVMPEIRSDIKRSNLRYHVAMTATDALYNRWQSRIMYFYYKKIKDGPGSDMGGFTRILHSGKPDNLMDEIPTFVVDPLPKGVDRGYVVLHRPWAFVQWLDKTTIEEEYILMAEPDHIFVNPLPNLADGDKPVAYPFSYIRTTLNEKIIRKYYPEDKGPVTNIDPVGNSPVIIKKYLLKEIAPTWMNVSISMKHDKESDKAFGWVLEMDTRTGLVRLSDERMFTFDLQKVKYCFLRFDFSKDDPRRGALKVDSLYGYAVASALHDVRHILRRDFMIQPPYGLQVGKKFIIHYTYGCDYTQTGKITNRWTGDWQFNKRHYYGHPPPRNLSLPPPGVPESVVELVKKVNEATASIPGWDAMV